jgi:hypothetical protein
VQSALDGKEERKDVIYVDYDDVESLKNALEEHNVHTVLSTISIKSDVQTRAQLNLIKAADKSSITKRFAPSEWGFDYTQE